MADAVSHGRYATVCKRSWTGDAALSHQQKSLCKRAIWVELMVEDQEARVAAGEGVDGALHTQLVASLTSLYRLLGIRRVARQVGLADYLKKGRIQPVI
jgi:hypothetical protein